MSTSMASDLSPSRRFLAEPAMRRALEDFVRRRVPPSDVEDIVQTVLVEALAAPARPRDEGELRRWLLGIARHKVVDHHRRASREAAAEIPDVPVGPPPVEEQALVQWAEQQAGASRDAKSTLEWMAREGEGEKLEAIAAEEKVPAARVRQRVSRMRRWMKERWLAELAAAAALVILGLVLWRLLRKEEPITQPRPEPVPTAAPVPPRELDRARTLRELAFESCDRAAWQECLDRLDEARALDPDGDADPKVGAARARATDALKSAPPSPTTSAAPTQEPLKTAPVQTAPLPKKQAPAPTIQRKSKPAPQKPFLKEAPVKKAPSGKDGLDADYFKK